MKKTPAKNAPSTEPVVLIAYKSPTLRPVSPLGLLFILSDLPR